MKTHLRFLFSFFFFRNCADFFIEAEVDNLKKKKMRERPVQNRFADVKICRITCGKASVRMHSYP